MGEQDDLARSGRVQDETRADYGQEPARAGNRPGPARVDDGQEPARAGNRPGPARVDHGHDPARPGDQPGPAPGPAPGADRVYRFIERFSSVLSEAGFPPMPARVFVALLTSDSGLLTASQLADLLHASPAAVSGGVRYLLQVGLASSEREPGSRRHRYRMPDNVWHEITAIRDRMFGRWAVVLQDGIEVVGPDSAAGVRLASTVRYFEFLQAEMPMLLARWREREAATAAGDASGGRPDGGSAG
jgi:predicted transcriptional regulator